MVFRFLFLPILLQDRLFEVLRILAMALQNYLFLEEPELLLELVFFPELFELLLEFEPLPALLEL